MKTGLVLEGGGMRGIYTSGVLDYFLEQNLFFSSIFAVSAGVSNALSYVSKQKNRNKKIYLEYANDKRYLSFRNFLKTGSFFGWDFIFKTITDEILPFDNEEFKKSNAKITVVVSNMNTGNAEYVEVESLKESTPYIIASSSLPLISKIAHLDNKEYLDGGIYDAIPLAYSESQGFKRNVLILTRDETYRKKRSRNIFCRIIYHKYPFFLVRLKERHNLYNATLKEIREKEKQGRVFVIRPSERVNFKRFEKNTQKLKWLYELGYNDAKNSYEKLVKFLNENA